MAVTRNYFQKFPTVSYNDYVVRDISARTKLSQYLIETGVALLPYTVKEGERADSIASFYYKDPYYAWAIYLVNGIIDPYSEWPKDSQALENYIETKYGSVEVARDTVLRYEVDWASDTTLLSPAQYEALPQVNKKYWSPQYGYNREVINYYRRKLDWSLNNNRLDQITVISNNSVNSLSEAFTIGERLYQYNYLDDVAVKSTVVSVDATDANTRLFTYSNASFNDITFSSGNTTIFVRSTSKILPTAKVSGTNIPTGAYVKHIINGNHFEISAAPTGSPSSNSTYTFNNPATAVMTVQKVDFSEVRFANGGVVANPNSFFTYETAGQYRDEDNYVIGRRGGANVVVLTHVRIDTNAAANALLSNSHLSNDELPYWRSVDAYTDELEKNELRKEIFVLDVNAINSLDDNLEALLKNV